MYVCKANGAAWLGFETELVRGRLECTVIGMVCDSTVVHLASSARDGASTALSLLIDLRGIDGDVTTATAAAMLALLVSGDAKAPVAFVGGGMRETVAKMPKSEHPVAWFATIGNARRWMERVVAW